MSKDFDLLFQLRELVCPSLQNEKYFLNRRDRPEIKSKNVSKTFLEENWPNGFFLISCRLERLSSSPTSWKSNENDWNRVKEKCCWSFSLFQFRSERIENLDEAFINVSAVWRRCEPLTKTLKASNGVSTVASTAPTIVWF